MKLLPAEGNDVAMQVRDPAYRLSLKAYIENSMIPDIMKQDSSGFLDSLFWGSRYSICGLYNSVWEQYAQERPFTESDFRVYWVANKRHEILYARVTVIPKMEELGNWAIAFVNDTVNNNRVNIKRYRIQKGSIGGGEVVFEAFGPNGRAGATNSMPEARAEDAQNEVIDLIWSLAFNEKGFYEIYNLGDPDEYDFHDGAVEEAISGGMNLYMAGAAEE